MMMNNFLLAIGGVAISLLLLLLLIRLRYDRLTKEIWRSLKSPPSSDVFTADMVAGLDEPVQRYFLHAIAPGTPLASYVELEMNGSFRLKPDAEWLPMQASQIISTVPGFIWRAKIGKRLMNFSGADYYFKKKGRTKFSLWGLIPLVDAQNKDVNRSAAGRLGAEYIWLPSALLPHNGVTWKAIAKNTIQADFRIDGEPICLTLTIDARGKLLEVSLPRWGNAVSGKSWRYTSFIADVSAEATFSGYTIPAKISAGWLDGKEYRIFFQSSLVQAEFC
ncbi:MAG: DUF6544 family protein [Cyanobacteria bacterium J06648_1]